MLSKSGISWIAGDAEQLPIETASVDAYTIAFGIRNVTRVEKVDILLLITYNYFVTIKHPKEKILINIESYLIVLKNLNWSVWGQ